MGRSLTIAIIGAGGQLGRSLCNVFSRSLFQVYALSRRELDVTVREQVNRLMSAIQPDAVIHTAALVDVERCERNPEMASHVNVEGTRNLSEAIRLTGALMMYVSTDYVFDGKSCAPYTEMDSPNPINVYGKTKLEGEHIVQSVVERHIIIRTSSLFGSGDNFVTRLIENIRRGAMVPLPDDLVSSPTYILDLAGAIRTLLEDGHTGLFHLSNKGAVSRHEWGNAVAQLLNIDADIEPRSYKKLVDEGAAPRPEFTALHSLSWDAMGYASLRGWREALSAFICDSKTL